eukprot:m.241871 g.241871  ORF g.241871 m.241871 type:complete len:318 (-) comp26320_c1_seq3:915-1868(-)
MANRHPRLGHVLSAAVEGVGELHAAQCPTINRDHHTTSVPSVSLKRVNGLHDDAREELRLPARVLRRPSGQRKLGGYDALRDEQYRCSAIGVEQHLGLFAVGAVECTPVLEWYRVVVDHPRCAVVPGGAAVPGRGGPAPRRLVEEHVDRTPTVDPQIGRILQLGRHPDERIRGVVTHRECVVGPRSPRRRRHHSNPLAAVGPRFVRHEQRPVGGKDWRPGVGAAEVQHVVLDAPRPSQRGRVRQRDPRRALPRRLATVHWRPPPGHRPGAIPCCGPAPPVVREVEQPHAVGCPRDNRVARGRRDHNVERGPRPVRLV